jgi:GT2 family glycosyltransferase
MFKISASIVTYKTSQQELNILLESLLPEIPAECIVIIDNSPDETLRKYVERFGIRYVAMKRNVGFGSGHNRALEIYRGLSKYHLLINPDIICQPGTISRLYEFMEEHPDVGWVMPKILYPDGTEQRLCKQLPTPYDLFIRRFLGKTGKFIFRKQADRYELRHLDMSVSREIPCLSGCFMFVRTSVFEEVGGFDERYFMYMEDVDLCRRILKKSKAVFYPYASVIHEYAKGSYRNLRHTRFHVISAIRYFTKWGWLFDAERKLLNERTHPLPPKY